MLLVEDNPTDVFVIAEVLEKCGPSLRLHVASDGQDALNYLQQVARDESTECPALVLLDLNVPKVPGVEVLRQLRSGSRCRRTPVIVVTSSTADGDRAAAQSLGAEAYFPKPNDLAAYAELGQLVIHILGRTG